MRDSLRWAAVSDGEPMGSADPRLAAEDAAFAMGVREMRAATAAAEARRRGGRDEDEGDRT